MVPYSAGQTTLAQGLGVSGRVITYSLPSAVKNPYLVWKSLGILRLSGKLVQSHRRQAAAFDGPAGSRIGDSVRVWRAAAPGPAAAPGQGSAFVRGRTRSAIVLDGG